MFLSNLFLLFLVLPQFQCRVDIISTTDPQNALTEMRRIVKQELNAAFQTYKNVTINLVSSIPPKESEATKAITQNYERELEKYTALKNTAEEAGVDISLCLLSFELEDPKQMVSYLHECIEDEASVAINELYKGQKLFVESMLNIVYKVEKMFLNCEGSDQSCVDEIVADVEKINSVVSEMYQIRLSFVETKMASAIKEVDICIDKYSVVVKVWESTMLSFEKCIQNAMKKNKIADEL